MLFPYTYVPHQMEKMQEFIDFIFFDVWCKAPIGLEFHPNLFDGKPELQDVMSEFGFSSKAAKRGKAFYKDVKTIYEHFEPLTPPQIKQFKKWYWGNNDLKKICVNNPAAHLVRYSDIDRFYPALSEQLASFFKGLYSQSLLGLAPLESKIGIIGKHYTEFTRTNNQGKCPFCGINDILGPDHKYREAYDHYLPKAFYPFNSINFRNLVPACHHCNSTYKGSKDTAFIPKDPCREQTRRKLFYPFSTQSYHITLHVTLQHAHYEKLTRTDIGLSFGPPELAEEIATWKEVYGIEERYRAKLCSKDARVWVVEVLDEWRWHQESAGVEGRPPEAYLRAVARHTEKTPYASENFLKCGFLQACKAAGTFDGAANANPSPGS
ncbi:hypothetical protein D3C76_754880 [compost metagenome]